MNELSGCRLLYTRSQTQDNTIIPQLQALGAEVFHLPLTATRQSAFILPPADILLFTGVHAVTHFFAQTDSALPCIAIGKATEQALIRHGKKPKYTAPAPYNSEALLSIWHPQGKRIAIIAARGGRDYLRRNLSRDNTVHMVYAYERYCPSRSLPFREDHLPHAVFISSRHALRGLLKIAEPEMLKLLQCRSCIVALSPRIAAYAKQHRFQKTVSAETASETAQLEALMRWWTGNK